MRGEPAVLELIDHPRVPLHRRAIAAYVELLEPLRRSMRELGWCRVDGLVAPSALPTLVAEAERLAPLGHRRPTLTTVATDVIAPASGLRTLAEWDELTRFVADTAGELSLFRSSDSLGAVTLDVMVEGDSLAWTAEPADLVAVVVLQTPERGGVLTVERSGAVTEIDASAGDLVVIDARRLRRAVSKLEGRRARLDLVVAYHLTAGSVLTDAQRLERFGRLAPERRRGH